MRWILWATLVSLLLAACATVPKFDTRGIDSKITPQQAAQQGDTLRGTKVLWGGVIITSTNLKDRTQFEILAYPLDDDLEPDTDKVPLGRFIAWQSGYLETTSFSQGRRLTVSGTLQESYKGRIGEADYTYPVLKIEQLYLWPHSGGPDNTQFHLGVGVMFYN